MVGEDADGQPVRLETFHLADSAAGFAERLEHPQAFANEVGVELGEYLWCALSNAASLAEPKDLTWLLALYARDRLARMERASDAGRWPPASSPRPGAAPDQWCACRVCNPCGGGRCDLVGKDKRVHDASPLPTGLTSITRTAIWRFSASVSCSSSCCCNSAGTVGRRPWGGGGILPSPNQNTR